MPKYRITLSNGRTFEVEADSQPSEADVMAQLGASDQTSAPASAEPPGRFAGYKRLGDMATNALPAIGGVIGGMVGAIPGAAAGAAAGTGLRSLAQHAAELPGAVKDIAGNLLEHPSAVADGFRGGASRGQFDVAAEAALTAGGQKAGTYLGGKLVKGAQSLASGLMQSALKPGIKSTLSAVKGGKMPPVVRTLLNEGVNVTPGGIEKLNGIINATNDDIAAALGTLPQNAMTVSAKDVVGRLAPTAAKFGRQVNPVDDVATVTKAGDEFAAAHGPYLTLPDAQKIKQGTYQALSSKAYGEVKGASIEAQKALARGLKEEIELEAKAAGIDIAALNAREGGAIEARDAIAKRVAMVGNRDPAGLAWLAHSPTTFIMALAERSPAVKTLLARGLWQSAAKASGMPVDALKFAMGAIASRTYQEGQE